MNNELFLLRIGSNIQIFHEYSQGPYHELLGLEPPSIEFVLC